MLLALSLACAPSVPAAAESPVAPTALRADAAAAAAPDPAPALAPPAATGELFPPEPGPDADKSTAFVFVGDTGKGTPGQTAVAEAVKAWCAVRRCDFVALLGDNLYPNGATSVDDPIFADRFEKYWEGFDGPFMVALGNHDHYGSVEAELAYATTQKKWVQPARWYSFTRGPTSFFVLDTGKGTAGELAEVQVAWLKDELKKDSSPWRVAYGHHPMHSSGLHGGGETLTRTLEPTLKEGGVQFWLCGHEHNNELIDDGSFPVEVIAGAGADVRKVKGSVPGSVYLTSVLGFGYLVLTPERAELAMVEVGPDSTRVGWRQGWDAR